MVDMKLTEETYYSREADNAFFSVSQYKSFCRCPAATMARLHGEYEPPTNTAFLVGGYFDAYFDGSLELFKAEHPEILVTRGDRKGGLKSEFRQAEVMIERAKSDKLFMKFMSGEKQKILTAELFGVPWKCKLDSFSEGICITDLKTCQSFGTIPRYRYDIQGAIYQRIAELNGYGRLPFYLAACTKETVPGLRIFQIPDEVLDLALSEVESNMPLFIAMKNGEEEATHCGSCDYCKSTQGAEIHSYLELLA